jgi:hypothetical protein
MIYLCKKEAGIRLNPLVTGRFQSENIGDKLPKNSWPVKFTLDLLLRDGRRTPGPLAKERKQNGGCGMKSLIFAVVMMLGFFGVSAWACTCNDLGATYACRAGANVYTCSDGGQLSCHNDCGYPGLIPEPELIKVGYLADEFTSETTARYRRLREKEDRDSQRRLNVSINGLAAHCGTKALDYEEAKRSDSAMVDGEYSLMRGYYVHFANGRVGFIGFDFGYGVKRDCGN